MPKARRARIDARVEQLRAEVDPYGGLERVSITEVKRRLEDVLDMAERAPVVITRWNKPAGVLMSMEQYERLTLTKQAGYER